jgi:uncharacterized protein YndB with AHSA1/START domain
MPEFSTSIDIDAPPEIVFEHLVTPEGMTAWMCQWADLDARPGGVFSAQINGTPVRGSFVEVDPPRRVVFTWGIPGNDDLPAGSTTVAFTLTGRGEGTRLDLLHSDLPEPSVASHREGWEHYLPRLRRRAAGEDVGPDRWPDAAGGERG